MSDLACIMDELARVVHEEHAALAHLKVAGQHKIARKRETLFRGVLAFGDEGKQALEAWLHSNDRQLQSFAAAKVYDWDPVAVLPILRDIARWRLVQRQKYKDRCP